jgi:non-homologous end joining protein Ku
VEEKKGRVTNLMAALEASLAKAKGESPRPPAHAHARNTRRRRSA